MKKFAWRKYQEIFLAAILFAFEKAFFFKDSQQNVCHRFTCYHWLRKFPFIFQQIIIQNSDV